MTRPPTRADQVRMMSAQGSRLPPRQATMTTLDLEDSNVRPDAWFAYVMPVQMGVEMIGAGRYGYWERQPSVEYDGDCVVISGRSETTEGVHGEAVHHDDGPGEDEPVLVIPKATAISVLVAKAKHVEATPLPVVKVEPGTS